MRVIILGGGIAGLGTAYYLKKYNYRPVIIEKEPALGGLASSYKIDNFWIEKYYHHFFQTDKHTIKLIRELNLKEIWPPATKTGCFYDKAYPFNSPIDLLFFKPLSILDRLKFGVNILRTSEIKNFDRLDKITAREWFTKIWGERIYEKIFKHFLQIKFGSSINKISAAFASSRIRTRTRSGTSKGERFGYIQGGLQKLFDSLSEKLDDSLIHLNSEIMEIKKLDKGFSIKFKKANKVYRLKCDYVVNTLPLPIFIKIVKNFPEDFIENLRKIEYEAILCVILGLKKRLSKFYWLISMSPKIPFGGIIEHTNFIPPSHYNGQHIAYVFKYLNETEPLWKTSDKEIVELYTKHLKKMFPDFRKEDILWSRVSRDKYATPVFVVNYSSITPETKTEINGLYLCGSFQVYPFDRNLNTILNLSYKTAKTILKDSGAGV